MNQLLVKTYRGIRDLLQSACLICFFFLVALLMPIRNLCFRLFHARHVFTVTPFRAYSLILKAIVYRGIGLTERSAILWSKVLGELEKVFMTHSHSNLRDQLAKTLVDVYTELLDNYLISGYVEDAALIMIRAHQTLGIRVLPGYANFDVQTAHLVKTGITASKMLDSSQSAGLVIQPVEEHFAAFDSKLSRRSMSTTQRPEGDSEHPSAKIIPFPAPSS